MLDMPLPATLQEGNIVSTRSDSVSKSGTDQLFLTRVYCTPQEGNIVSTRSDSVFKESSMDSADAGWDDEWFDEDDPHHPSFDSSGFSDSSGFGGSRMDSGDNAVHGSGGSTTATTSVEMQTWAILEYCNCGTLQVCPTERSLFLYHSLANRYTL